MLHSPASATSERDSPMHILTRRWLPDVAILPPITPRTAATVIGCLAIPFWATWPLLAAMTTSAMPLFQYFALIYGVGALVLFLVPRSREITPAVQPGAVAWAKSSRLLAAIMVGCGLLFSSILFVSAFAHIPVAQANLILYLWPVMVVALCAPLRLVKLRLTHVIGILLGLLGAAIVISDGSGVLSWAGIGLAAAGGFVWAVSVVFRMWQGENAPDALRHGLLLAAAVAAVFHLGFEATVIPPLAAFAGALLVGIIPTALGTLTWDHGVRKGDKLLLATVAYATPLVGALFLVIFGFAPATWALFLGAVLIVAAGVIASR
ncbi:MAG: DMT family transporter [Paracoccaceae bacterium]